MAYVDGFVLPLPKKNLDAYREISNKCGASTARWNSANA